MNDPTPERSSDSAAAAAAVTPAASETSLDLNDEQRAIRAEYEAYKLKTKEWQNKVRERDVKMRQQLQESTELLQTREQELNELSKRVASLEAALRDETKSAAAARRNEDAVASLSAQLAEQKSESAELKRRCCDTEEELRQRVQEVKSLRQRLDSVEREAHAAQRRASWQSVVFVEGWEDKASGQPLQVHADVRVVARVRIPSPGSSSSAAGGTAFAHCFNAHAQRGVWVDESLLPPALTATCDTAEEIARAAAAAQLEAQRKADRAAHDEELRVAAAERDAAQATIQRQHDEIVSALRQERETAGRARDAAVEQLREAEATLLRTRTVDVPQAVQSARAEAAAAHQAAVSALRDQIRVLEEYKAKAQLAMRTAGASAPDGDKIRQIVDTEVKKQLESAVQAATERLAAQHAEVVSEMRTHREETLQRLSEAEAQLLDRNVAVARLKEQLAAAQERASDGVGGYDRTRGAESGASSGAIPASSGQRGTTAAPDDRDAAESQRQQQPQTVLVDRIVQTDSAEIAAATAAHPEKHSDAQGCAKCDSDDHITDHHLLYRQTGALSSSSGTSPSATAVAISGAVGRQRSSADVGEVGDVDGSYFSLEAVLQTLGDSRSASAALFEDGELLRLRQQLRNQTAVGAKLREDLRELALREKHHLEQEAALKEQIRDMERSAKRTEEMSSRHDYVKNVVLKALTCGDAQLRSVLFSVVAEVLHVGPEERAQLLAAAAR